MIIELQIYVRIFFYEKNNCIIYLCHPELYSTCATKTRNESSLFESSSIFILYFYAKVLTFIFKHGSDRYRSDYAAISEKLFSSIQFRTRETCNGTSVKFFASREGKEKSIPSTQVRPNLLLDYFIQIDISLAIRSIS